MALYTTDDGTPVTTPHCLTCGGETGMGRKGPKKYCDRRCFYGRPRRNRPEDDQLRNEHHVRWFWQRKGVKGIPESRPGYCTLCGRVGVPDMDHNHDTMIFRGWLCRNCNLILGQVGEDADLLEGMAAYLRSNGGTVRY